MWDTAVLFMLWLLMGWLTIIAITISIVTMAVMMTTTTIPMTAAAVMYMRRVLITRDWVFRVSLPLLLLPLTESLPAHRRQPGRSARRVVDCVIDRGADIVREWFERASVEMRRQRRGVIFITSPTTINPPCCPSSCITTTTIPAANPAAATATLLAVCSRRL